MNKTKNTKGRVKKKTIESVSMLIPSLDPRPPTVSVLCVFFLQCFYFIFYYLGCLVRGEIWKWQNKSENI